MLGCLYELVRWVDQLGLIIEVLGLGGSRGSFGTNKFIEGWDHTALRIGTSIRLDSREESE